MTMAHRASRRADQEGTSCALVSSVRARETETAKDGRSDRNGAMAQWPNAAKQMLPQPVFSDSGLSLFVRSSYLRRSFAT